MQHPDIDDILDRAATGYLDEREDLDTLLAYVAFLENDDGFGLMKTRAINPPTRAEYVEKMRRKFSEPIHLENWKSRRIQGAKAMVRFSQERLDEAKVELERVLTA